MRSWRRSWRLETLTLAKIGGSLSTSALPCRELAGAAVQDEQAEVDDKAGLLRHRDEFARRQAAELGVVPPHQRLESRDGAVLEPDDRLEQDLELVPLDGPAQIRLERQAVRPVAAHRRRRTSRCGRRRASWHGTWRSRHP